MKGKIYIIGEILVKFSELKNKENLNEIDIFKRDLYGSALNTAIEISKLGEEVHFISKVGKDILGKYIINTLNKFNINTSKVLVTEEGNTGVVFTNEKDIEDMEYACRKLTSGMLLDKNEIELIDVNELDYLHFSLDDLVEAPIKYAIKRAIELAVISNSIISFDLSAKSSLWKRISDCKSAMMEFLNYANIIKISHKELELLIGDNDITKVKDLFLGGTCNLLVYIKENNEVEIYNNSNIFKLSKLNDELVNPNNDSKEFMGDFLYLLIKNNVTIKNIDKISSKFLNKCLKGTNYYINKVISNEEPTNLENMHIEK